MDVTSALCGLAYRVPDSVCVMAGLSTEITTSVQSHDEVRSEDPSKGRVFDALSAMPDVVLQTVTFVVLCTALLLSLVEARFPLLNGSRRSRIPSRHKLLSVAAAEARPTTRVHGWIPQVENPAGVSSHSDGWALGYMSVS